MSKISLEGAESLLDRIKAELDGGFLFIFAGEAPATPSLALDMVTEHTQLAKLSVDGDGVTGLTFDAAVDDVISKAAAEAWSGLVEFDGFVAGPGTLAPTFFRFCTAADNGRGASAAVRLQGTVGGPASSADMKLGTDTLTDNGSNTTAASIFNVRLSSIG